MSSVPFKISLAAARVNAGLTQEEVAKAINKNKATIVSYEKGETIPTYDIVEKLEKLYGICKDYIFFGK